VAILNIEKVAGHWQPPAWQVARDNNVPNGPPSGKQFRTDLSEFHIDPGLMFPKPTFGNRRIKTGTLFGRATTDSQERQVDQLNMDAAILYGLSRIGDLDQFARRGFRVGEWVIGGEFHCMPILAFGKSGLTSAPCLPHALQTNDHSISDSLTSSGHRSVFMVVEWLHL
jgi:hypothetical protein